MQRQTIESLDDRLVNLTRFVLALSAFIIIYVDPSEPDRLVNITYTTLALYTVYSGLIYFLSSDTNPYFTHSALLGRCWMVCGPYFLKQRHE